VSNFLAIATATEVLRQILEDGVKGDVTGAEAKTVRPNAPVSELPDLGVGIYLYQVTPNAALRNADLPTRRIAGEAAQRPRVALNLNYLLTFYGNDSRLEPQRLLGSSISALHAQPVLSREKIRKVIDAYVQPDPQHFLASSNLDEEMELVKFTLLPLTLEELSRLWSIFFQTAYSLSVAYQGTVVLIDSKVKPQAALPVRERSVYVVTFRQSSIERVVSAKGPDKPIVWDSTIVIQGRRLRDEITQVRIGPVLLTTEPDKISDAEIIVALPPGLRAGVQAIQVVQPRLMGKPPIAHAGIESNIAPFVLHPTITASVSNITNTVESDATFHSADISVSFKPKLGKGQRVMLLLNEFQTTPVASARAYSFNAPPWSTITLPPRANETDSINIPVTSVIPGPYIVRVQVDGAESLLDQDAAGKYIGPQVTI